MKRLYEKVLSHHMGHFRQMAFLIGPRQAGKTYLSRQFADAHLEQYRYLNWDDISGREAILSGSKNLMDEFIQRHGATKPVIIFDEIHKYRNWKSLLKGYFDSLEHDCQFIVTGSAKLNTYRRAGDSMMGRYFPYRIHPLSVAECVQEPTLSQDMREPKKIKNDEWESLLKFGGFPEPFLMADDRFYKRWFKLKQEQLFHEDLLDLMQVQQISQLELLAELLKGQVGGTVKYAELAKKIQVSEPTVKKWLEVLKSVYYCFDIRPWSKNITRSLLKEPKVYLWDWSLIEDIGARYENVVASHLHKAVHYWSDIGLGEYGLYYLRDKDKAEVDFLVVKDGRPWFMVEVKASKNQSLNSSLMRFNNVLQLDHVFQVVFDLEYVDESCFDLKKPMIVSAKTFLSQLA